LYSNFGKKTGLFWYSSDADDRDNPAPAASGAIAGGVVAFVGQRHAGWDVRPDIKRDFKLGAVANTGSLDIT
jgi:hypothetical protein